MRLLRYIELAVVLAVFALAAPTLALVVSAQADDKVYDISVEGSPYLGAKDAPVTIIEFIDYQ